MMDTRWRANRAVGMTRDLDLLPSAEPIKLVDATGNLTGRTVTVCPTTKR